MILVKFSLMRLAVPFFMIHRMPFISLVDSMTAKDILQPFFEGPARVVEDLRFYENLETAVGKWTAFASLIVESMTC